MSHKLIGLATNDWHLNGICCMVLYREASTALTSIVCSHNWVKELTRKKEVLIEVVVDVHSRKLNNQRCLQVEGMPAKLLMMKLVVRVDFIKHTRIHTDTPKLTTNNSHF